MIWWKYLCLMLKKYLDYMGNIFLTYGILKVKENIYQIWTNISPSIVLRTFLNSDLNPEVSEVLRTVVVDR